MNALRLGFDLDNTIICYDRLFARVAADLGLLNPDEACDKNSVKRLVITRHSHDAWTALQGEVYGPRLAEAEAFVGVKEFMRDCRLKGARLCIISHKTRYPALGPQVDLRAAALGWLEAQGWFLPDGPGLTAEQVEFHSTRADKVAAIARRECEIFFDDLPEVFAEPSFPSQTRRVLFDPAGEHEVLTGCERMRNWTEAYALVGLTKEFSSHV